MKTKRKRLVLLLVLTPVLCCGLSLNVFAAGEDLFQVADKIVRDVYKD